MVQQPPGRSDRGAKITLNRGSDMPDQTVKVTFTAPSTFTFDPETASMSGAGKINMHRDPGSADWHPTADDSEPVMRDH